MKTPKAIKSLFGKRDRLIKPVVYFNGTLMSLSRKSKPAPHRFGGPLPKCIGIGAPKFHRLVLTLDSVSIGLSPGKNIPKQLPLIFNFDLCGLSTDYVVEDSLLNFSHDDCIFGHMKAEKGSELPYARFPKSFPKATFGCDIVHKIKFAQFQELCTPQGLYGTFEEPDVSGHLFTIIPVCDEIPVPLWSAPADPDAFLEDGYLCIFDFNPKTGRVDASNQCT